MVKKMKSSKRALLVEDNKIWQETLNDILLDFKFEVDTSSVYVDALTKFESSTYDLIVIDLGLGPEGNKDGLSLLEDAYRKGIPSIVVSGQATASDVKRAKRYDALRVFQKHNFKELEFKNILEKFSKSDDLSSFGSPEEEIKDIEELLRKFVAS